MKKEKTTKERERETRKKMLNLAATAGMERDLQMLFEKYDDAIAKCGNEFERAHLRKLAAVDIYNFFGFKDGLVIDQQLIIPADPDYKPPQQ